MRRNYFDTSASGHGLDEPCYVVEPRPVGSKIVANGLPVFTLNYTNDDDGERQLGKDSRLIFTAPENGRYLIRVSDTRGWSGERFAYRLIVRRPSPDFAATLVASGAANLPAESGKQFLVRVERADGFDGEVRVEIEGVPPGFFVSTPVIVQAGHLTAAGCVYALPGAKPGAADFSSVKLTATASVNGKNVSKSLAGFPSINVTAAPKQLLFLEAEHARSAAVGAKAKPTEITLAPGSRVSAWLRVDRARQRRLARPRCRGAAARRDR